MAMTEMPALSGREIMAALRCCSSNAREGGGCGACPMYGRDGRLECSEMVCCMAADEIGRLLDATEWLVKELTERMVTLARESNIARERGLEKVSGDLVLELNAIQEKLVKLGRTSVVGAEPVEGQGWRVTLIMVDGTEVFKAEGGADAENG